MKNHLTISILVLLFISMNQFMNAALTVHNLFQNSSVLQRNTEVNIWGKGDVGKTVTVTASWNSTASTTIDADGKWLVKLPTSNAGGPYIVTVTDGATTHRFTDILLGEVWVCGGQSNMAFPLAGKKGQPLTNMEEELNAANYPNIRFFKGPYGVKSPSEEDNITGTWKKVVHPDNADISAIGYFFARKIHHLLGVPVGLIVNAIGASSAEAWTPRKYLKTINGYENIDEILAPYEADSLLLKDTDNKIPTTLYNTCTHPLIPYTIKGVIWHQGEGNRSKPVQYQTLFPSMIEAWRNNWGQGDFPFYFAQISPLNGNDDAQELREAQFLSRKVKNTEMVVTIDVGDRNRIHPPDKKTVGERFSLLALQKTYGLDTIRSISPMYKSFRIKEDTAVISFTDSTHQLLPLTNDTMDFKIAGLDGVFHSAKAFTRGDKLYMHSPYVSLPTQATYGWSEWVSNYFYNTDSLPASSFRTFNALAYSNKYTVDYDANNISGVLEGTNVDTFKSNLILYGDATLKVIDQLHKEKTSGVLLETDYVKIISKHNYDSLKYSITTIASSDMDSKIK